MWFPTDSEFQGTVNVSELPTHIFMLAMGAVPLLWKTTHWCSINTMSRVWSFVYIYLVYEVFPSANLYQLSWHPLKLRYISMTSWLSLQIVLYCSYFIFYGLLLSSMTSPHALFPPVIFFFDNSLHISSTSTPHSLSFVCISSCQCLSSHLFCCFCFFPTLSLYYFWHHFIPE